MLKTLVLATAATLVSCAPAVAEPPAKLPHPAVGDTFTYVGNFATVACSQWTVTSVADHGFDVMTCDNDKAFTRSSDEALVRILGPSGHALLELDPESPGLQFPLTLDKSWTARYSGFTAENNAHFTSSESCTVAGFETVVTAAGSFPAYRIDCNDQWTSGSASGQAHQTSWYAPKAHTVVKIRNDDQPQWNVELASYKIRP